MIRVYHDSREQQDGTPPAAEDLTLVAEVYTDDPHKAVELTRHPVGGTWRNNPEVNPLSSESRSTEHGDVLEKDGHFTQFWFYRRTEGVEHDMFVPLEKSFYEGLLSQAPATNKEPRLPVDSGCGFQFDF